MLKPVITTAALTLGIALLLKSLTGYDNHYNTVVGAVGSVALMGFVLPLIPHASGVWWPKNPLYPELLTLLGGASIAFLIVLTGLWINDPRTHDAGHSETTHALPWAGGVLAEVPLSQAITGLLNFLQLFSESIPRLVHVKMKDTHIHIGAVVLAVFSTLLGGSYLLNWQPIKVLITVLPV